MSSGKRIDATLCKLRMALFYMDMTTARALVTSGSKLAEEGGDWDRRNRLKAYTAVVLMVSSLRGGAVLRCRNECFVHG